ncbi:MAG: biotin transporter BioY [Chlamydiae bacterium]|nr:biotin transporter BioY [Chlamydiota bacterium]
MTSACFSVPVIERFQTSSWVKNALMVVAGSIIIGLSAYISVPLPFTPVPLVLQCHMVLFIAALLGSKRGFLATAAFIAQGALGLPVFAGGKCGVLCLLGPTGGYLFGYLAAAYVTGYLVEMSKEKTVSKSVMAMFVGNIVIYLFGMSWLSTFVGVPSAFGLGVAPFIIGDLLKLILSSKALKLFSRSV